MSAGSLVVPEVRSTGPTTGLGPVDSLVGSSAALADGRWVDAGVSGLCAGMDVLGAIADPFGTLVSAGCGWALEHFGPLRHLLDGMAGDPDAIRAFAATWRSVAEHLHGTADELVAEVDRATSSWSGAAAEVYGVCAHGQGLLVDGFGVMVTGVATATETAGELVAGVRQVVVDSIGQVIGEVISDLLLACTGFGVPVALARLSAAVGRRVSQLSDLVDSLLRSMGTLGDHLDELLGHAEQAARAVAELSRRWDALPPSTGVAASAFGGAAGYGTGDW